jgi:hypothetical protein
MTHKEGKMTKSRSKAKLAAAAAALDWAAERGCTWDTDSLEWKTDRWLKRRATMIAYNPKRRHDRENHFYFPRGWYVRQYHSIVPMEAHLRGTLLRDFPHIKHPAQTYSDSGPFDTEEEARDWA